MGTISQRELRNHSGAVMRSVEAGETLIVTRNGTPVAQLGPISASDMLPVVRPSRGIRFSELRRVRAELPVEELLDDLRAER